ncbi:sulfurtransferase TusA family protein [Limimaricola hongkongensis]|uniref:tRNA 5-methylaminomethyl-2-thiouridine synthase TusA n=1 Tax=Limimaricola hongkongensis DSM 17492 TaxID=1122180 RepID=A0A017HBI2_9RHOB|nr:sulfurtransferase TusA family protein [Limimaricola hongkongensis]EYD71736.1 tRNA 5-methylaminomethyl-2-thiouridine synthase TusA [Limimaricola hongkongensis DSM 17492]
MTPDPTPTDPDATPHRYDARGLICPLPVLRARKLLAAMAPGEVLEIISDDPVARIDLPHFCAEAGHDHLGLTDADGAQTHRIRRG